MVSQEMKFIIEDEAEAPQFPFKKTELIAKAKALISSRFGTDEGKNDLLAEDFEFRFPIVELGKAEFIDAFGSFKVDLAFPDMSTQYYGFRMDPNIPGRLWFDTIGHGTHTGPMGGPFSYIKPTGKTISLPPQTLSFTFNEQGQLKKFTGGYVVDRRMGNTGGLGGLFGIMHAIGKTLPFPEAKPFRLSWRFQFFRALGRMADWMTGKNNKKALLPPPKKDA